MSFKICGFFCQNQIENVIVFRNRAGKGITCFITCPCFFNLLLYSYTNLRSCPFPDQFAQTREKSHAIMAFRDGADNATATSELLGTNYFAGWLNCSV